MSSAASAQQKRAYRALVSIKAARVQLDAALPDCHAAATTPARTASMCEAYEIAAAALAGLERTVRESHGLPGRPHRRMS